MNNKYLAAFGVAALIVTGAWLSGVGDNTPVQSETPTTEQVSSVIDGHIKGNKDATVNLVEYSDLQCPACGVYYSVVKQLMEELGDSVSFEYRHFPLRTVHRNAESAALAAEAAGLQGKFWEMHDILFEHQKEWSAKSGSNIFNGYAEEIGLDVLKFESDLSFNEDIKNKVESDFQKGLESRVNSTPSFFLNGIKMQNPQSYEEFKSVIQQFVLSQ